MILITPNGGHLLPSSIFGANLLWKNAQKNEKKNRTSEVMNKTIPIRSPVITGVLWYPCNLPSRDTSRHQRITHRHNKSLFITNIVFVFFWIITTDANSVLILSLAVRRGQGLGLIIW